MQKEYVQKIEDLQEWERVQEWKIQALQALSSTMKAIIQSLWGQLRKIGEDVDGDHDDLTLDNYDAEDY
jgi:hypothetical protein